MITTLTPPTPTTINGGAHLLRVTQARVLLS